MEEDILETNIDSIPDEMLVHIFTFLRPKMIKICALACKRWNRVISNSPTIMNNFKLNLKETDSNIKKAMNLNRKIQFIKSEKLDDNIMKIIAMNNLRTLQLSHCVVKSSDLIQALGSLKILENFHAKNIKFSDKEVDDTVRLDHLKHLRVETCDILIMKIFDTNSLRQFEALSFDANEWTSVYEILMKQKNLEKLSIGGILYKKFFHSPDEFNYPFKLKSLKIEKVLFSDGLIENLFKFLLMHRDLESLSLMCPVKREMKKFVLENLTNLKHLGITTAMAIDKSAVYYSTISKSQIKSVKFFGCFQNLSTEKFMLNLFPKMTALDMSEITTNFWFTKLLLHIAKNNPELESLSIPNFFDVLDDQLYFPKLKVFEVKKISNEPIYIEFLKRHRQTLEKIGIGSTDDNFIRGTVISTVMNCVNLKYLTIVSETSVITEMFKKVSFDKSWTLELRIKHASLSCEYLPLKFHFPDDVMIFKKNCTNGSDELIRELSTVNNYGLNAFVNQFK